jgi:ATP-dependent RNA helicase RhlE
MSFSTIGLSDEYVHRIGRAGSGGEAVSLVCADERKLLADIERMSKRSLPREVILGFEPGPNAKPEPIRKGRGRGQPLARQKGASQAQCRTGKSEAYPR